MNILSFMRLNLLWLSLGFLAAFLFFLPASAAHAAPVNIDVGAFSGPGTQWFIVGETGVLSGNQTVDLDPGTYSIRVGNNALGQFQFDVDAVGDVTSQNPDAATGSGNTLTLNTVTITIDPAAYVLAGGGQYFIVGTTPIVAGIQNVVVVPNLGYSLRVGNTGEGQFHFDVDASGNVVNISNPDAATASSSTLTFNTTTITVDPGGFNGPGSQYFVNGVTPVVTGIQNVVVVPNLTYFIRVANTSGGQFGFDVDANGDIQNISNPDAATASGDTITFNATTVTVDPGAFSASDNQYFVNGATPVVTGIQNVAVVPNLTYFIRVGNNSLGQFSFDVDAVGNITSVSNADAASASGTVLTFNTVSIDITPDTGASWFVIGVTAVVSNPITIDVVPGLGYTLRTTAQSIQDHFNVAAPCSVSPSQLSIDGTNFDLTCTSTGPTTVSADKDAILRKGARNRNEGANPLLHLGEQRRQLVGFDLTGIDTSSVTTAELILTINDENDPGQWGSSGRLVGAHNVTEAWVEGDGKGYGLPGSQSTRGSGDGVTWKCAIDTAIENQKADCSPVWDGGTFATTATDEVLHTNGMTGEVVFDVTSDVTSGGDSWIIKKANEGQNGNARYYSRDNDEVVSNPDLAPRLVLTF